MKAIRYYLLRLLNNNFLLTIIFLAFVFARNTGFYSIKPCIDYEGSTALVIREWSEPFFNSQERFCLESGDVSDLVCKEVATSYREQYPVLISFSWWKFAHEKSLPDNLLIVAKNRSTTSSKVIY